MYRTIKISLLSLALIGWGSFNSCAYGSKVVEADSIQEAKKQTNVFVKILLKPLKWIGRNWNAYDPRYSTPSFYNWVGQLQNTSSMEMLRIKQDDMMDLVVRSKWSHKIGPHLGYRFLFYGYTIDLNALRGTNRRSEFTLSFNSNLVNIDIVRRRTGGDFMFKKWCIGFDDSPTDMLAEMEIEKKTSLKAEDSDVNNDVSGFNINYFTNHRKYSNPAAFSNGAIQLRSVGSPIIGFGYMHNKIKLPFANDLMIFGTLGYLIKETETPGMYDYSGYNDFIFNLADAEDPTDVMKKFVNDNLDEMKNLSDNGYYNKLIFNPLPTTIRTEDWHLQLGYAYNMVFSRRLLLGLSAIVSPGLKRVHSDCHSSLGAMVAQDPDYKDIMPLIGVNNDYNIDCTNIGFNAYGHASLTYNFNRWRAGVNAKINYTRYHSGNILLEDGYGSITAYVGYCFGRKKQYRWDGKDREAYIKAALTPYQIEEMHDTTPTGNLDKGATYQEKWGSTKYKSDHFNFNIMGSDLVKGPDGKYGTFEIEDGRVTHGNDTEQRLVAGTVLDMDEDGVIELKSGHRQGFRVSNWLKSQLKVRQIPINWYPEMLHYALRGKLTMYLRNYKFGTKQPVKVVLDNFYLCHGNETGQFYIIGCKAFYSHSSYSIIGSTNINNRMFEVYIESKDDGKNNNIYFNPILKSGMSWMKYIPSDRIVSRLSIPGTHDAGSASLAESSINSMGHTQNFSVIEQMADGVRAFDLRLKKNMKYGHTMTCLDGIGETLADTRKFLKANPSEFVIFMIGSDEGVKWSEEMKANFNALYHQYADLMVENFDASTKVGDVRGKILVIKRQRDCPFGKLLEFSDNTTFTYDCFKVEDEYKMHKTYKKSKLVAQHLREAYENEDYTKWYITFNSIAWDPRHHKPYYSAWGAVNVRRPMNKALRETIEQKGYNDFGMVFLDFYNDHGDNPYLMRDIIQSNFHLDAENEYISADQAGRMIAP